MLNKARYYKNILSFHRQCVGNDDRALWPSIRQTALVRLPRGRRVLRSRKEATTIMD